MLTCARMMIARLLHLIIPVCFLSFQDTTVFAKFHFVACSTYPLYNCDDKFAHSQNIPQFGVQIAVVIILSLNTKDYSSLLVAIFSMIFTIISILLSTFEYCLSEKFLKFGASVVLSFEIVSPEISQMRTRKFFQKYVYKKNQLISKMAQITNLRYPQIERLKPQKTPKGAKFAFIVGVSVQECQTMEIALKNGIADQTLKQVCVYVYDLVF